MSLDFEKVRERFSDFDFKGLFVEELGWSQPSASTRTIEVEDERFTLRHIAQLGGVVVIEVQSSGGGIPHAKTKLAVHRAISKLHLENLLIFVDKKRSASEWYWVKRDGGKEMPRPHPFVKGQPGDLFFGRIAPLLFEISDFNEEGNTDVAEVARRLKLGLDVEKVTKKFYGEFHQQHLAFIELIGGIADERQRRWYASVLLNRLMFIWFLQRKGFIDGGDLDYLERRLTESRQRGADRYFDEFLKLLFFEGFAKPESERSPEARQRLGNIRYLNGGLFLPHAIELRNPNVSVPDKAFENLFALFRRYSWNLNDSPAGDANEINPDVLGYIFEKYINQKAFGAYYTRPEITNYLCERTIHRLVLDSVNGREGRGGKIYKFQSLGDLVLNLDADLCRWLLLEILPGLSILDPACGSGAFLVAAMKTLINIYGAVIGAAKLKFQSDNTLRARLRDIESNHPSVDYFIKKSIIANNIFGVDIMEEAVEIARLRLFLALVASAHSVDQLEPLPNIDFNLLTGNSLIGLTRVDEAKFDAQLNLFGKTYRQVVEEKNRGVAAYRFTSAFHDDLRKLRDGIEAMRREASEPLDSLLLEQFRGLGIKYEQATWDDKKQREGKGVKRPLTIDGIRALEPFHWGYEFDEVLNKRGGFDAIITNPPWESVEPSAKAFFSDHSEIVTKNKLDIKDFEKELARLLEDTNTRESWLHYLSEYNHQRLFFRSAPEYANQIPVINGKKQGKDINLYKLFLERCHQLLRPNGECGLVIPSGIYTDLGAKRLRELLFETTEITGIFGFENRKEIFENVHRSFKFIVLTFKKAGSTDEFPAAFMRHHVEDLAGFPSSEDLMISVELIRRLSPDSLSLLEFRSPLDIQIAEKMAQWPLLGEKIDGSWNVDLHREFNTNDDADLFNKSHSSGMLPLYEGRMIWHFDAYYAEPRFFVNEKRGRLRLMGRTASHDGELEYERFRLAYRDVASNTNERTMVSAILPRRVFTVETFRIVGGVSNTESLYLAAVFNSFLFDWLIRKRVSAHVSSFFVYQMPVPRLREGTLIFDQLVKRAARLSCTRSALDELASKAGVQGDAVTLEKEERSIVRAEIDAIVAHLYGITEAEFEHVLAAFPLVDDAVKDITLRVFCAWQPPAEHPVVRLIASGESAHLEFKATARWDLRQSKPSKDLEYVIVKTVAAFLNTDGGTLLIGVEDDGNVLGLSKDYQLFGKTTGSDAFQNWLMTLLLDKMGKDVARLIRVSFHRIGDEEICRVDVDRAPHAVFVKDAQNVERLHIRVGNSTRELSISEALHYCNEHFQRSSSIAASEGAKATPALPRVTSQVLLENAIKAKASRKAEFPTHGLFKPTTAGAVDAPGTDPTPSKKKSGGSDAKN